MSKSAHSRIIRLCGGLQVTADSVLYTKFPTRRSALLLTRLALAPGKQLSRDDLARLLWPDETIEVAKTLLRNELARLRKALVGDAEYIATNRNCIWIDSEQIEVDLTRAKTLLKNVDPTASSSIAEAKAALALIRDPLLPEYNEEWLTPWRQRHLELHRECAAQFAIASCQHQAARAKSAVSEALKLDPTNESVVRAAMEHFIQKGMPAEAAKCFAILHDALNRDYGVSPAPDLLQLATQLKLLSDVPRAGHFELPESNVPHPIDEMLGRSENLQELLHLLHPKEGQPKRLITIRGTGGLGKTRLATEVALEMHSRLNARVWFFDLSEIREGSQLLDRLLDQLHVERNSRADLVRVMVDCLGSEPAMFVLDNFEQLDPTGTEVVRRLLQSNGQLRIVVTSRRKLGLPGEHDYVLPGLDESAWVELYKRTAQTDHIEEPVLGYLSHLDGLPLAIRLAASYSAVVSGEEASAISDAKLALLISPTETGPTRHQRLLDTIEWGYQLLAEDDQIAFASLSIFRDGWTLDSAQHVLGLREAHRMLERLVSNSFVTSRPTENGPRFYLLDTLKEFAQSKLSPSDLSHLQRQHFEYFFRFVDSTCKSNRAREYDEMSRPVFFEYENVRQAFEYAVEHQPEAAVDLVHRLYRYWSIRDLHTDGLQWMRRALHPTLAPREEALGALFGAGLLCLRQGLVDEAQMHLFRAAEMGTATNDEFHRHIVLGRQCEVMRLQGRYRAVIEEGQRCLDYFAAEEHAYHRSFIYPELALVWCALGDLDQALLLAETALATRLASQHAPLFAEALTTIGIVHFERGDHGLARHKFEQARERFEAAGISLGVCQADEWLARVDLVEHRYCLAQTRLSGAKTTLARLGNEMDLERLRILEGLCLLGSAKYTEARGLLIGRFTELPQRLAPNSLQFLEALAIYQTQTGSASTAGSIRADADRFRQELDIPRLPSESRALSGITPSRCSPVSTLEDALRYWSITL